MRRPLYSLHAFEPSPSFLNSTVATPVERPWLLKASEAFLTCPIVDSNSSYARHQRVRNGFVAAWCRERTLS